jgi:hypothetical protein
LRVSVNAVMMTGMGSSSNSVTGAGVFVVILIIVIARFTLRGKGSPAARLASFLAGIVVFWGVITVSDPVAGGKIGALFGAGIPAAAHGIAAVIRIL